MEILDEEAEGGSTTGFLVGRRMSARPWWRRVSSVLVRMCDLTCVWMGKVGGLARWVGGGSEEGRSVVSASPALRPSAEWSPPLADGEAVAKVGHPG